MSKNILVTGLVLGKETHMCSCNNVNFDWLFSQSTDLLWADNVIVTENEMSVIKDQRQVHTYMKAVDIIFAKLFDAGFVKVISDSEINPGTAEELANRLTDDLDLLSDIIEESNDERDPIMSIGKSYFCFPSLWTFYASIYLSFYYNANFSLSNNELAFLKELIPRKYGNYIAETGAKIAMEEVLGLYLPELTIGHPYLFEDKETRCGSCTHNNNCKDAYLNEIEKQVDKILAYRQYDEIRQLCEVLDKLCARKSSYDTILTGDELWSDLQEEAKLQERKAHKVLRQINRWRKISTYVSIGLGAASFFSPYFGLSASIPAATSQFLSDKEGKIKKDTSWINFVSNPELVLNSRPCI